MVQSNTIYVEVTAPQAEITIHSMSYGETETRAKLLAHKLKYSTGKHKAIVHYLNATFLYSTSRGGMWRIEYDIEFTCPVDHTVRLRAYCMTSYTTILTGIKGRVSGTVEMQLYGGYSQDNLRWFDIDSEWAEGAYLLRVGPEVGNPLPIENVEGDEVECSYIVEYDLEVTDWNAASPPLFVIWKPVGEVATLIDQITGRKSGTWYYKLNGNYYQLEYLQLYATEDGTPEAVSPL